MLTKLVVGGGVLNKARMSRFDVGGLTEAAGEAATGGGDATVGAAATGGGEATAGGGHDVAVLGALAANGSAGVEVDIGAPFVDEGAKGSLWAIAGDAGVMLLLPPKSKRSSTATGAATGAGVTAGRGAGAGAAA